MTITAQQIIDGALSKHWSFRGAGVSEGAALQELNEVQKRILLDASPTLENFVGETESVQTGMDGASLVALDENDVPYFTTTIEPGYVIRFDAGVPYVVADDPIIVDPFGEDGDSPGLPLPDGVLRLFALSARTASNPAPAPPLKIELVKQEIVRKQAPRTGLQAFLSANRIIPVRIATGDLWTQVTSIEVQFIRHPELATLADELVVPDVCGGALQAAIAEFFSLQTEKCPASDRQMLARSAQKAYDDMIGSVNIMDAVTTSNVIYRR